MRYFAFVAAVAISYIAVDASAESLVLKVETAHIADSDATGAPSVVVSFIPESATDFGAFTIRHTGKEVRFMVDGQVVFAPHLVEPILGGAVMMSGNFSPQDALDLVSKLRNSRTTLSIEADDR